MKLEIIIKEVAKNLNLPYKDVNIAIKFTFYSISKNIKGKKPKISARYIGTFTKKLSKRETYKKYLEKKLKNENN